MEALLYGCMTWAPRNAHYRQLQTTHHKLLLRIIGYHRVHGTYLKMSYAKALKKTGSQSVEAIIRHRGWQATPKAAVVRRETRGGGRPGTRDPAQHWQKSLRDGTTSRHSELYTAPRQLIGGLSESTGSSGQRQRARGRECRGTQGFCWGRRDLWRRGTRAKKRLAMP